MVEYMTSAVNDVDLTKLSPDEREELAINPNTPADILKILAGDTGMLVHYCLAINPNAPADALVLLADDENLWVRTYVAEHKNTPQVALRLLATDLRIDVCRSVAANKNTTPDVLGLLAKNKSLLVRLDVAANPNTPQETLVKLAEDIRSEVRKNVAVHPNTPQNLCLNIYNDLVQQGELDKDFAIEIVQRDVLGQTEVLALIAVYGEKIAQVVAENVPVAENSLLEKVVAEYNYHAKIKSTEKDTTLARE